MAPRGVQLSLLIAGLAAASAAESGGLGKWNDCSEGKANNDILFSNFALRFEAGQMMLEASGEVANPISNGTFQFTVGNIESGEEIGYKGPYDVCCEFFNENRKNCTWVGEYPNQERVGGCPIAAGAFTATIKRPLWVNTLGVYRAQVELFTETGEKRGCVKAFAKIDESNVVSATKEPPQVGGLVVVKDAFEGGDAGGEGGGGASAPGGLSVRKKTAEEEKAEEEEKEVLGAMRAWTGVYGTEGECGVGCCCITDDNVQIDLNLKGGGGGEYSGHASLTIKGKAEEGSPGACKGNKRLSLRHFALDDTDPNLATKKFCAGACQTLKAVRRAGEGGVVEVGLSNVEHPRCGERRFVCKSGECASSTLPL